MSSALWIMRLSPGRLFTVIAAPPMRVPSCIGRRREPPAVMRHMQSLTFATGMDANACTKRSLIFCLRARIWRPTMLLAALVWMEGKEGVATELVERRDAQQGHVARDLLLQEFDALEHAGLAGHGCGEGEGPADEDETGAQRHGLEHVAAAAHAAVHHDRNVRAGVDDAWQHAQRRCSAIELPSAMV